MCPDPEAHAPSWILMVRIGPSGAGLTPVDFDLSLVPNRRTKDEGLGHMERAQRTVTIGSRCEHTA